MKCSNFIDQNKRFWIFYLLCALSIMPMFAQNISVKGYVFDKGTGDPLIGASVIQKGTQNGVVTDVDGNFVINMPVNGTLVVHYIGYNSREVQVTSAVKKLKIGMEENSQILDEVVAIGYGSAKKKDLTGSIASIRLEDSPRMSLPNMNVLDALKGQLPGLDIGTATNAGGNPSFNIRGQNSIKASNNPLIVVDGVPMMMNVSTAQTTMAYGGERDGGDAMSTINPDDIAQITLLKGASAAALYGAVAANGAIMITTKSASSGKVSIDVSSNTTVETVASLPKFQNSYGMSNEGTFSWGDKLSTTAPNYAKDFYQTGFTTNNSIALSGGNEHISSYFSYANVASHGVTPKNTYMSHNLLAKVGFHLWKKVHIDVSARYNNQDIENQAAAGFLGNPVLICSREEKTGIITKIITRCINLL